MQWPLGSEMSSFDLYFSAEKLNLNRNTGRALQDSARRFYFPEFLTSYKKKMERKISRIAVNLKSRKKSNAFFSATKYD